jgi:hypothetical protein
MKKKFTTAEERDVTTRVFCHWRITLPHAATNIYVIITSCSVVLIVGNP